MNKICQQQLGFEKLTVMMLMMRELSKAQLCPVRRTIMLRIVPLWNCPVNHKDFENS